MHQIFEYTFRPTDNRLGRHVLHDPRSRSYDLATVAGTRLPTQPIQWARWGPIFDQGDLGCCTATAALGLLMTEPFSDGTVYTMDDVRAFYHGETVIDGIRGVYPPTDTGSTGLAAMKLLRTQGKIKAYAHAFSPAVAVAALVHGPIAVGSVWLNSMFEPRDGRLVVDPASGVAGGHEYVVDGWDPGTERLHMTNSWGESWGEDGGATIELAQFRWLLAQRGDAVQPR